MIHLVNGTKLGGALVSTLQMTFFEPPYCSTNPRTPAKRGKGGGGRGGKRRKEGMGREGREGELCSCTFSLKIPCNIVNQST